MERSPYRPAQVDAGIRLMTASKKGFSAKQLERTLDITYRYRMVHVRIASVRLCALAVLARLVASGKIVEADETYYGPVEKAKRIAPNQQAAAPSPGAARLAPLTSARSSLWSSAAAMSARSMSRCRQGFGHEDRGAKTSLEESRLHTDESKLISAPNERFASHETVKHSVGEYARGDVNPIRRKAISRSSSAACAASISIAERSICIGIWPSSISATITGSSLAIMTGNVQPLR